VKKNLGNTYDHYKAVLGNCEIDYTVVTSTITTTMAFILLWQEGSNALLKFGRLVKLSESDLIHTTRFPRAAVSLSPSCANSLQTTLCGLLITW